VSSAWVVEVAVRVV
jgi:hypothetical protein